jgi:hypothetical protein
MGDNLGPRRLPMSSPAKESWRIVPSKLESCSNLHGFGTGAARAVFAPASLRTPAESSILASFVEMKGLRSLAGGGRFV